MPSQLVNESSTEANVGSQTRPPTTISGISTITAMAIRSGGGEPDGAPCAPGAARSTTRGEMGRHLARSYPAQLPKIETFCCWMLLVRPFTSPGLLRNVCSAGIITVDAKSGRVSRSMYCAMCFAPAIIDAAFFCRAV